MKRILVTGGSGFIASHLIDYLLKENHTVFALDNIEKNNKNKEFKNYTFIKADITDVSSLESAFNKAKPDTVIHLAAKINVTESLTNPEEYFRVNVKGTLNILKQSVKSNVKKFIFSSSAAVYGTKDKVPLKEDESLLTPLSTYAVTKITGEGLCHVYSNVSNMKCICLRFFNVYGPGQSEPALVPKFINLISKGKPVTIYGDGSHTRDFIYISDVVQGIVKAIDYEKKNYEIFNIAGSTKTTVLDLVRIIEKTLGKKAIINFEAAKKGDIPLSFANIENAKRELGFVPGVGLGEGVGKCINQFWGF